MSERGILLSYRRADAAGVVGRLFDRLGARYGHVSVFMDVDSIPFGQDFRRHIQDSLARCGVVLLVIGPRWAGPRDPAPARIHDADDPVRIEAEAALARGIPIIPVLVDGAVMPAAADLPPSLEAVAYLNAARVDTGIDFHQHTDRLIAAIDRLTGRDPDAGDGWSAPGLWRHWFAWAVVAVSLALPVAVARARLAPPWPREAGLLVITAVVMAAAFLIGFRFLRTGPLAWTGRALTIGSLTLVVLAPAYLFADSAFTYDTPTTGERWARGLTCTPEAQLLYKDKCPYLGTDELQTAEYDADRLWTAGSVAVVQVGLLALWLSMFLALSAGVGALLVRHARHAARRTVFSPSAAG